MKNYHQYFLNENIKLGTEKIKAKKIDKDYELDDYIKYLKSKVLSPAAEKRKNLTKQYTNFGDLLWKYASLLEQEGKICDHFDYIGIDSVRKTQSGIPYLVTVVNRQSRLPRYVFWYFDDNNELNCYTPVKGNRVIVKPRMGKCYIREKTDSFLAEFLREQFPDDLYIQSQVLGFYEMPDDNYLLPGLIQINLEYCIEDFEAALDIVE